MNYPETQATDGHWAQDIERRHTKQKSSHGLFFQ
jgi:hypothetical protein